MVLTIKQLRKLLERAGLGEPLQLQVLDHWPSRMSLFPDGEHFNARLRLYGTTYDVYDRKKTTQDGSVSWEVVASLGTYNQVSQPVLEPDRVASWVKAFRILLRRSDVQNTLRAGGLAQRVEQFREALRQELAQHGRVTQKRAEHEFTSRFTLRDVGYVDYWDTHSADLLRVVKGDVSEDIKFNSLQADPQEIAQRAVRLLLGL